MKGEVAGDVSTRRELGGVGEPGRAEEEVPAIDMLDGSSKDRAARLALEQYGRTGPGDEELARDGTRRPSRDQDLAERGAGHCSHDHFRGVGPQACHDEGVVPLDVKWECCGERRSAELGVRGVGRRDIGLGRLSHEGHRGGTHAVPARRPASRSSPEMGRETK
jgi:hypothetical protein